MAFNRRKFLVGLGGAVVGLPFLEGLASKKAQAAGADIPPFALFYRRGNGVQQSLFGKIPNTYTDAYTEPERWWPTEFGFGAIPAAQLATSASAMSVLSAHASKLTIVKGMRHTVGSELGHREGFIQGLTGAGVKYPTATPDPFNCDPLGESLDNRIARELTPAAPQSLFLGLGMHDEGGISFLNQKDASGKQITRAAEENLVTIYNRIFLPAASDSSSRALLQSRRVSVNDLVRDDINRLKNDPRLSASDKDRLALHLQAIRDVEVAISCLVPLTMAGDVQTYQNAYNADPEYFKGSTVSKAGGTMSKLAALAIACGATRSVVINMGPPQDTTAYQEVPGAQNVDFHSISHRQTVDGDASTNIGGAQLLHHNIDVFHLQQFAKICDALKSYDNGDGTTLLDKGACVHFSDLGSGQHNISQLPYLYVGGAGGNLTTGQYVDATGHYLSEFLNAVGGAVGVKNSAGTGPLDDFNADNNGGHRGRLASIVV